jgi:hypothetical protein
MDIIQKQRAAVAEHIRLENEQKWTEVPRTLVQDARAFYDFVPVGQFKGAEGVAQLYQIIGSAFSNLRLDISAEYDLPGCSIREGVITATHTGAYMGVPASGTVRVAHLQRFSCSMRRLVKCWASASIWITERCYNNCKPRMSQRLADERNEPT